MGRCGAANATSSVRSNANMSTADYCTTGFRRSTQDWSSVSAVAVSGEWAHVVISDFAAGCAAFPTLGGFTLDNGGAAHGAVFLDNVRFLP